MEFRYNPRQMIPQLFLSLLFAVALQGSNGIRGQILVPTTQAQGRMEVILEKSGAFFSRTYSDNEGHFKFINLPDGEYVVSVRLEGYDDLREIPNFGRDGSATMNLVMTRKTAVTPDNTQLLYASYPAKIVDDYLKALEAGDVNKAASLFITDGWVESPFLGRLPVRQFIKKVAEASSGTRLTVHDVLVSAEGHLRAVAYYLYDWRLKDGSRVSFDCADVFNFDPSTGKIQSIVLVYDTHPVRGIVEHQYP